MAKKKSKPTSEPDSVYFLKIVMYFILGSIWVEYTGDSDATKFILPVGFIVGVIFASHDHFKIDRKIEYAILLGAVVLSAVAPTGFVLTI